MNAAKKSLIILLLPLVAFTAAHKFYLSVTQIGYSDTDKALQITTRVFIDDIEKVLQMRYDFKAGLATDDESKLADEYLEKYLRTKFVLKLNHLQADFRFIGKEYDTDMIICYLEIPNVDLSQVSTIAVQNEILTDLFDEQQNVVHFKIKGKKKSFVLIKSDTKGELNMD